MGPHVFQALPWVHPIVLAIIWAHQLTFCSRLPVAEIDRGTIDVLLGLPVSRWQAYLSESAVFLLSGLLLFAMAVIGNYLGSALSDPDSFPTGPRLAAIVLNGYCLYVAVGGISYFFSSLSNRRGRAIGAGLAVVLSSFLLSFLVQFWEPAASVSFLSLLDYFRPAVILQNGDWPVTDMTVLLVVGVFFWVLAGIVLDRRDICTV